MITGQNIVSTRKGCKLQNLFLDPNNYRFVDDKDYKFINENELLIDKIQKRTRGFIEGNKRENIKDLISSFKANGFMDVDVIQVRDLGNSNYLILEGNRRVTTLKALQEDYENNKDIGNLNPEIFENIPFEIHNNEEKEKHLIIMGLKHISGNKQWSAINQAQLMYDFLAPYWKTNEYSEKEIQLCDSIGISKVKLRTSQRALHLIKIYKNSDYGDQFKSDMYYSFVEIIKSLKIKEWLEWDDNEYLAKNTNRLLKLFSWLSIDEKNYEDEEENEDARTEPIKPIITTYREIKTLSLFINNDRAILEMEKYENVSSGLLASGELDKKEYENLLNDLERNIEKILNFKNIISLDDLEKINELKNKFLDLIPKKSTLEISRGNFSIHFKDNKNHFTLIQINKYKIFNNFKIEKLNKINIFAGLNNSGKSSLLEAIYFLTKQNDIVSFLEMIKLRNKLQSLNPLWLNTVFTEDDVIDIKGKFNLETTSVKFIKFDAGSKIDKKDDYLVSYGLYAEIGNEKLDNVIHTFEYDTLKRENEKVKYLCNSILKSPYFYNFNEIKETYSTNKISKVDGKTAIRLVLEFIKKEIDITIEDISLTDMKDVERFIVDSTKYNENLEITNYGEGLQRIFEIAIAFAYARNGVVCIDEFETAIHYSLLVDFTKFIQELADIFNVQVFLTSHSKECIDAFVNNGYKNDEISAYFLENSDNKIEAINISGEKLKSYIDSTDFDLRGTK